MQCRVESFGPAGDPKPMGHTAGALPAVLEALPLPLLLLLLPACSTGLAAPAGLLGAAAMAPGR
jgi:hypothetical protein